MVKSDKGRLNWLGIAFVPELRWHTSKLLDVAGDSITWLYRATAAQICGRLGVVRDTAERIRQQLDGFDIRAEAERLAGAGISVVTWLDPDYPEELRQIYGPPAALFFRGAAFEVRQPHVAIVGSRKCTAYGRQVAEELAGDLAAAGVTVVSGLALGIDTAAHRGALSTGRTVAVLGNGLDTVYPRQNRMLARQIETDGAIISELPPGTPPLAMHFPARNRIISGLSQVVVIVEASARSGALITADFALEQSREVMVVPGSVKSKESEGCHALLRAGAALVTDAGDVLELLDLKNERSQRTRRPALSADEAKLVSHMDGEPVTPDRIVQETGLKPGDVLAMLSALEVKGVVRPEAGGKYRVVN